MAQMQYGPTPPMRQERNPPVHLLGTGPIAPSAVDPLVESPPIIVMAPLQPPQGPRL